MKTRQEPENLLILTRTRTDRHGRRHSVAVPLIPPPDGEKFEGGYHVERNPITGGATLVPPEGIILLLFYRSLAIFVLQHDPILPLSSLNSSNSMPG